MPKRAPLIVPPILSWCDAHHAHTGSWLRTSAADRAELPLDARGPDVDTVDLDQRPVFRKP